MRFFLVKQIENYIKFYPRFLPVLKFSCNLFHSEDDGKVPAKRDLRIRKEFTAMTFEERKRFVRAYKFVSRYQPYRRRFEHLVGLHQTLFRKVYDQFYTLCSIVTVWCGKV